MVYRGPPREQPLNDAIFMHMYIQLEGGGGGGVVQLAMRTCMCAINYVYVCVWQERTNTKHHHIFVEAWHKWKNHFHEMKGDVRMSVMKKKGNKKMHTPRHQ